MNVNDLTPKEKAEIHKKIEALAKSPGWDILKQIMQHEIGVFYRKISSPASNITLDTLNFNRGIIEGSFRLMELPTNILQQLSTDIAIASAMGLSENPSATADKKGN